MHKRNAHHGDYPLSTLCNISPNLRDYIIKSPKGGTTIDFSNPDGVKALNAALLQHYYKLKLWDIPKSYLCPPVPGRADYIHYIADLISGGKTSQIPNGKQVRGLDIGTGANLIYPIIAHAVYGWQMLGTDIDKVSIASAKTILAANPNFAKHIKLAKQNQADSIFKGIVTRSDKFDFCICNPPFHASAEQATQNASRKAKNLTRNKQRRQSPVKSSTNSELNFAGQANELWCEGGELAFITKIVNESRNYAQQIKWFTSLVSKNENVPILQKRLQAIGVNEIRKVDMSQGNKKSRFVAWRF